MKRLAILAILLVVGVDSGAQELLLTGAPEPAVANGGMEEALPKPAALEAMPDAPSAVVAARDAAPESSPLPNAEASSGEGDQCKQEGGWTICPANTSPAFSSSRATPPLIKWEKPARRERVADRKFWLTTAVSAGLMVLDLELTNSCVQSNRCREANPLYGNHPSRARLYGTAIPIHVVAGFLSYRMKKHRHSQWWLPNTVMSAGHGIGVASYFKGR